MKFINAVIASALVATTVALPLYPRACDAGPSPASDGTVLAADDGADGLTLAQIDALTPQFGATAGADPVGNGNCNGPVDGSDGEPIQVPCDCPPDRDLFIQDMAANIAAGHAVNNTGVAITFPTDDSVASQLTRLNAAAVTLQNLRGVGVGCPVSSTTFSAQQQALEDGTAPPATAAPPPASSSAAPPPPSSPAAPPASTVSSASAPAPTASSPAEGGGADGLTFAQIDALTPQFGFQSDVNPTGSGDCDGAVDNASGQPIKIPCSCPPDRTLFINDMAANIAAGHAVNNTGVAFSFPTDNSEASQLARITAASITLQNLNGPGVGCPVVSTTFSAQAQAIQNGQSPDSVNVAQPAASSPAPAAVKTTPAPAAVKTTAAPAASTSAAGKPASTSASSTSASLPANGKGLSLTQLDTLTPQFDFQSGVNPTGTGNCDGAVDGANGKPIAIPCSCPPPREQFLQSLQADINAGHAVNNPSVGVTFPTDNSKNSQITRIQASLVALQNLNGSGQGCPAVSTTFSAQLKALTG